MPIKTIIDKAAGVIYREVTGSLSHKDIISDDAYVKAHPDFDRYMDELWDLRKAEVSRLSTDQIQQIAEYMKKYTQYQDAKYKVALVTTSGLRYGLARMYEQVAPGLSRDISVFKTIEEAEKWFSEPD